MLKKVWQLLHQTIPSSTDELLSILLKNRNIQNPATHFNPTLDHLQIDQTLLAPIIERINQAITAKAKIIVFGDYDVDGLCATTIMWETLIACGAQALPYIPHREHEGYGLSAIALTNVIEKHHPALIITVDCGISAHAEVALAQQQGVDVIVTDHHNAPAQLPDCLTFHDHHVCGAAVAYKLSQTLAAHHHLESSRYQDHLALAALGTICDIIPLSLENRAIVVHGLQQFRTTKRPGIQALCEITEISQAEIAPYHFGYTIGPRLNAQGRLESAMQALRLLCTHDPARAIQLAKELNQINIQRQSLTKELTQQASLLAETQQDQHLFVIGDPSWHPGVIGLIASHLVKEWHKPAIVWGSNPDNQSLYKASARSIEGFHITDAIRAHQELLLGHGGHPMAAGLSIQPENLPIFTQKIQRAAQSTITSELLTPTIKIDTPLQSALINPTLLNQLSQLAPFGAEYPEPIFELSRAKVVAAKAIGKEGKHLKISLSSDGIHSHDAIYWQHGHLLSELPAEISVATRIESNTWQGQTKPQLSIVDLHTS